MGVYRVGWGYIGWDEGVLLMLSYNYAAECLELGRPQRSCE